MPNRFIKEKCRSSRTLESLTDFEERLFWRLLTVVDDFGRFDANPQVVRSLCFPLNPGKRALANVRKCLQKLSNSFTLLLYQINGVEYGQLVNFEEYQGKPRAKVSKFPDPPKDQLESMLANVSRCSQMLPSSVFVSESESESESVPVDKSVGFEKFWIAYPRKVGKQLALKSWETLNPQNGQVELILQAVETQKTWHAWTKDGGQFIPYPATWLNQRRWEDELVNIPKPKPKLAY